MEALKDEVGDLCRRYQHNMPDGGATTGGISLPCRKSKPPRTESSHLCANHIFSQAIHFSPEWLGYRSKEESKTPNIGVPAK
ncbi:MAG: hypothetical protein WAK60_08880 [Sedimentisphaerales bacterium]